MDTWHILCQWKKCLLSRGNNRESVFTNSSWRECVTKYSVSCVACLLSNVTTAVLPNPECLPWRISVSMSLFFGKRLCRVIIYLYCIERYRWYWVYLTRSEFKTKTFFNLKNRSTLSILQDWLALEGKVISIFFTVELIFMINYWFF